VTLLHDKVGKKLTITRCVIIQKKIFLISFAADAWNHAHCSQFR